MLLLERTEVRPATLDDLDWIIGQLKTFAANSASGRVLDSDETHWAFGLKEVISKHLFLISQRGEQRTGLIAGMVTTHPFNPKIRVLTALFWWVDYRYRGTRAAYRLLTEFIGWGESNADWIALGIEANSPIAPRTLTQRGFELREYNYIREVA